jgi:hypothetical protein
MNIGDDELEQLAGLIIKLWESLVVDSPSFNISFIIL